MDLVGISVISGEWWHTSAKERPFLIPGERDLLAAAAAAAAGGGGGGFCSPLHIHAPPPSHLLAQRMHVFTTGHTLHPHRK